MGLPAFTKPQIILDSAAWYSKKVLSEKIEKSYPIGLLKAANMLARYLRITKQTR